MHMFGYGWPPLFVNVSIETVHIKGIVEYNLLYNRTCPDSCYNHSRDPVVKDLCEADLSPVDGCLFIENQTSILSKSLNCIVCNSSENCKFMGITEDCDLCLCLKVTTLAGSSNYTCMERSHDTICEYYLLVRPGSCTVFFIALSTLRPHQYFQILKFHIWNSECHAWFVSHNRLVR